MPNNRTALIWADPAQGPWLRAVVERAELSVVGAGSPDTGRGSELIAALAGDRDAVPAVNDLRGALTTAKVDVIVIAAPGDFAGGLRQGAMDREDAGALAAARARGVRVATLEPMPCTALQLGLTVEAPAATSADVVSEVIAAPVGAGVVLGQGAPVRAEEPRERTARGQDAGFTGGAWATVIPLLRHSQSLRSVGDVLEQFGQVRTISVRCWSGPSHGTLGARLYDSLDFVISHLGTPERLHATYVWPVRGRVLQPDAGESLRGLNGDLTANLRFPDGRSASLSLSDRAARWNRSVTILGEGGRLELTDDMTGSGDAAFTWFNAEGSLVDGAPSPHTTPECQPNEALINATAEQLSRLLDPRGPIPSPTDTAAVLATAGAALLSARTGEAESPETILRMVGR